MVSAPGLILTPQNVKQVKRLRAESYFTLRLAQEICEDEIRLSGFSRRGDEEETQKINSH